MEPTPRGSAVIRLDWWRFTLLAMIGAGIPTALVLLSHVYRRSPSVTLAMGVFALSLLMYFALRWRSLRIEVAKGTFRTDEFRRNPQNYIRGPRRMFLVWFACTLVAILSIVIYAAIVSNLSNMRLSGRAVNKVPLVLLRRAAQLWR